MSTDLQNLPDRGFAALPAHAPSRRYPDDELYARLASFPAEANR